MALKFGQPDKAVEAFRIWSETDPSSMMAKRMLSSVLLHIGKIDQAGDELAGLLKADENHVRRISSRSIKCWLPIRTRLRR